MENLAQFARDGDAVFDFHQWLESLGPFFVNLGVPQAIPGAFVRDLGKKENIGVAFETGR